MQVLAFRAPSGQVYIMEGASSLPPLGEGYEWTTVVQPDYFVDRNQPWSEDESDPDESEDDEPHELEDDDPEPIPVRVRVSRRRRRGILDKMAPLLIPREGQTPKERAQELIDALPENVRGKLAKFARAVMPPKAEDLPPFPGARS